ncbi:roundabout homolog 1-like isoform X4 [Limulus polyphemus]|uniref:Roundabout homolog 1-like isoform X4 n=1 Tax=Limulus polyphemus TaxID=6850 RepID=A0ABM1TB22_LIMPO|nr:roundabout homolog 1-like isoform X4 [Limulus polyphemus]
MHRKLLILTSLSLFLLYSDAQSRAPRITEHPRDLLVKKQQPAKLNCKADGVPTPVIEWYHNGKLVEGTSNRIMLVNGVGVALFFLHVLHGKRDQDTGTYWCVARNHLGEARSRNATLEVAILRDDFRANPRDIQVAREDSATLECAPPRGHPDPKVSWEKNGLPVDSEGGRVRITGSGNLVIEDVRQTDQGKYVCIAENMAGVRNSSPAILSVRVKPYFIKEPEDVLALSNQNVDIACLVDGDPTPTVTWHRRDGKMPIGRAQIQKNKSLRITQVRTEDEGLYMCEAENAVGIASGSATLTVHSQPSFAVKPKNQRVGLNGIAKFECVASGNPPPSIFWTKEGNQALMFPENSYGRFSVTSLGTLIISGVIKEDKGYYVCSALSVVASTMTKAHLDVIAVADLPPPIIRLGPANQTLPQNTMAMLPCEAEGIPGPNIQWFFKSASVDVNNPRFSILDSGTLQIDDLQPLDSGLYTCTASSESGETSWSATLSVESPRNPNAIFHRMFDPSTFPGPPGKPTAINVTETAITLRWLRSSKLGDSPLIGYTVEYYSSDLKRGWMVAARRVKRESFVVHNLRPDSHYVFLVRAENSHGLSVPSEISDVICTLGLPSHILPEYDLEEARYYLSTSIVKLKDARAISSTAVKLMWEIQSNLGYVEGFYIRFRDSSGRSQKYNMITVLNGAATSYVLTDLRKFTKYEFFLVPFYKSVEGPPSNSRKAQTLEDVPSAPPDNLNVKLKNLTVAVISWSSPPPQYRNGILQGYNIHILKNTSQLHSNITTNGTTTLITVYNLTAGHKYSVKAVAFTSVGNGPFSAPVALVMDSSYLNDQHDSGPASTSLTSSIHDTLQQPWFIALIGGILCLLLSIFFIVLFLCRRMAWKKALEAHLPVAAHKSEDVRAGVSNHEALWINHTWHPTDGKTGQNISESKLLNKETSANDLNYASVYSPLQYEVNGSDYAEVDSHSMTTFYKKGSSSVPAPYATTTLINPSSYKTCTGSFKDQRSSGASDDTSRKSERMIDVEPFRMGEDHLMEQLLDPTRQASPASESGSYTTDEHGVPVKKKRLKAIRANPNVPVVNWADLIPPPPDRPPSEAGSSAGIPSVHRGPFSADNRVLKSQVSGYSQIPGWPFYNPRIFQSPTGSYQSVPSMRGTPPQTGSNSMDRTMTPTIKMGTCIPGFPFPHERTSPAPSCSTHYQHHLMDRAIQSSLPSLISEPHSVSPMGGRMMTNQNRPHPYLQRNGTGDYEVGPSDRYTVEEPGDYELPNGQHTPESSVAEETDYAPNFAALPPWTSTTDQSNSSCTSARSSSVSSSDGYFYAEADFASAVARAAQNAGYMVDGTMVTNPTNGLGKKQISRQRAPRPTSPYSTDSSVSATIPHRSEYPKHRKKQLHSDNKTGARPQPNSQQTTSTQHSGPSRLYDLPSDDPARSKDSTPIHNGVDMSNKNRREIINCDVTQETPKSEVINNVPFAHTTKERFENKSTESRPQEPIYQDKLI